MKARLHKYVFLGALVACATVLLPTLAYAQAQIVGQVRDESGGVLPGVTVEAASPAIIEKVRTGGHRRPGTLSHRSAAARHLQADFSLTGFSTVAREDIDVPSEVVVTINADMKVGALEETITVSGETPQVDVQSGVAHAGHHARRHRLAAGVAQRHVDWRAVARRPPGHARRRRIAHDRAGRPSRARSRRRRRRAARRGHVDSESRRRVAELLRRHAAVGNHDHDERDSGRHVGRRHPHEQRAEGRRQHVQRRGVPRLQQRHVAERQHRTTSCAPLRAASTARTRSSTFTCSPDRWAGPSSATRCGSSLPRGISRRTRSSPTCLCRSRRPTAKSSTRISTPTCAAPRCA